MAQKTTAKKKPAAKAGKAAKKAARAAKQARPVRRKPETLRLRSVAPSLTVNDIERSLAWYRDVLGFTPKDRWEDGGKLMGVELLAGKVLFMIGQDDWKKGRDRRKGEGFRLYCNTGQDVDAIAARIKSKGGVLEQEPRDEPWGSRALTLVDPDGFKITISAPIRK